MEILDYKSNVIPLSTSYKADNDVKFVGFLNSSEEGLDFFYENYLENLIDTKINNYSSLYLTDKQKLSDIIKIQKIPQNTEQIKFNSSIIDHNTGLYLTLSSSIQDDPVKFPTFTEKNQKFITPVDRIFEITIFNGISARIAHKSRNRNYYYLSIGGGNPLDIKFSLTNDVSQTLLNCILDENNNKLCLFKNIQGEKNLILFNNNLLSATKNINLFTNYTFDVNSYVKNINPKTDTSWVSYNTTNVNQYDINTQKSRNNLSNNYLLYTQYSYISGNSLESNILTLKNQKTHKNYSYRSDFLEKNHPDVPTVDNRTYTGLFTGNNQEKGEYGITLNYEFYNSDYKMSVDKYNIFVTPESLYPYKQININDLGWNFRGSIAGENPYLSDKIFKNKHDTSTYFGEYLCSWLYKKRNGETVWLDRYYIPEKTSYASALSTSFTLNYVEPINLLLTEKLSSSEYYDVPYVFNSLAEESAATPQTLKSALYGINFFDKISDLVILPNTEYIYHRIGNNYVKEMLYTIDEFLVQNGLLLKNSNEADILIEGDTDDIEYPLNGDSHSLIPNYNLINNNHQFTISFWLKSDNWSDKIGHQILGNLTDIGFGLLNDPKITPFITIQNGKCVYTYNTNFELLDVASLENEPINNTATIKDLYRTDHLDLFYTINTESNTLLIS
jgi:hypothetical protein